MKNDPMLPPARRTCMPLAQEFCQGRGLEIGAASYSDFGVDAWNLDLVAEPLPAYRSEQMRYSRSEYSNRISNSK